MMRRLIAAVSSLWVRCRARRRQYLQALIEGYKHDVRTCGGSSTITAKPRRDDRRPHVQPVRRDFRKLRMRVETLKYGKLLEAAFTEKAAKLCVNGSIMRACRLCRPDLPGGKRGASGCWPTHPDQADPRTPDDECTG